jgi:2-oxoglutarate dehydrogenase E1 component
VVDGEPSPHSLSLPFVEELYAAWLRKPASVPEDWRAYFDRLETTDGLKGRSALGPSFKPAGVFNPPSVNGASPDCVPDMVALQDRVDQLIRAYRVRGHLVARLDPLERPRPDQIELDPRFYGFTDADLDRRFSTNTIRGVRNLTLTQILNRLRNTYCRSIGVQFMHIDSLEVKNWLTDRMEGTENRLILTRDEQLRILRRLTDAVIFEEFLMKKFLGAKSFSLEGAESMIPLLDLAIDKAVEQGSKEIVIGMAHRGRLNVLRNILRKGPREIFREFDDPDPELHLGQGDVKYHKGYDSAWVTGSGKKAHLTLCFNPSHLEFVNPVVLGRVRARSDRQTDLAFEKGLAIIIHGDSAFAGEGVVQETLNLSQLPPYNVGGALHIVLNNQIGFTTTPMEARSTTYATDVAKMLQSPIFHVNGEDPEAVAQVVRLALDFRRTFKRDVVIDMYGYRRYGHNEGDEPAFTQPMTYKAIRSRKNTRQGYLEHLLKLSEVTREEADAIAERLRDLLEKELKAARSADYEAPGSGPDRNWTAYFGGPEKYADDVDTRVPRERLSELLTVLAGVPDDFRPHPKITRWLGNRETMARGEKPLDWAAGEALALATLATEGVPVRLTGQDSERGTFSHRHSVLHDVKDGREYRSFSHLEKGQAPVEIFNSPLSEVAVLGYEYGYSLDTPDGLTIWEAQFGDFANVAQTIFDQFISSAEDKWKLLSGLVMLLPHGFEGMGPEHSSARLERFLQLSAEDNMQIVNLTTPAQLFHCLRRQMLRNWRKPLVVMSPKSLLRHPLAVSSLAEFTDGEFMRILPDALGEKAAEPTRILLTSGRLYYDLVKHREATERFDVPILRVEQLYPLTDRRLEESLSSYSADTPVVWVQDEPENMGAWPYFRYRFCRELPGGRPFSGACRAASASPATGSAASHKREAEMLMSKAFGG